MKPIRLSLQEVMATLEGRKTQHRLVIKPQPVPLPDDVKSSEGETHWWSSRLHQSMVRCAGWELDAIKSVCPYGQVGDKLWVRETHQWVTLAEKDPWKDRSIADGTFRRTHTGAPVMMCYKADGYEIGANWRPSIHMPRWASRITLEITGVRVERLQEIGQVNHADVLHEGYPFGYDINEPKEHPTITFARHWDSLHANRDYGWAANPWVWVLEYKRTAAKEEMQ